MLGDFDINYNKLSVAPASITNYANTINLLGCIQIVDKPTTITNSTRSIIDHIYANQDLLINNYPSIVTNNISDHLPLLVEYKTSDIKKKSFRPLLKQFIPDKIEKFLIALEESLSLPEYMASTDLSKLLNLLSSLTNLYFSKKKLSRKQYKTSNHPWITKDLLNQIKQKNKLYRRFLKTNSNAIFLEYKKCRNKLIHAKELIIKAQILSIAFQQHRHLERVD